MQFVFDGPMVADQFQQPFRSGLARSETGDEIDDFGALCLADAPNALKAGDLSKAGPVEMGHGFGAGGDGAGLDPAVRFVKRPGRLQIRRQAVEAALGIAGGKDRRTLRRCQF